MSNNSRQASENGKEGVLHCVSIHPYVCVLYLTDVTDSSSEGSVEDEGMRPRPPPQPKQKALQTRRSMLDHLDDSAKATPTTGTEPGEQAPPVKRVKKEEEVRVPL